jgi:hypothetical protein
LVHLAGPALAAVRPKPRWHRRFSSGVRDGRRRGCLPACLPAFLPACACVCACLPACLPATLPACLPACLRGARRTAHRGVGGAGALTAPVGAARGVAGHTRQRGPPARPALPCPARPGPGVRAYPSESAAVRVICRRTETSDSRAPPSLAPWHDSARRAFGAMPLRTPRRRSCCRTPRGGMQCARCAERTNRIRSWCRAWTTLRWCSTGTASCA